MLGIAPIDPARGLVRLSRAVPVETPQELVREIQRTLSLLQWRDGGELWISGDQAEAAIEAPELAGLGIPAMQPPYSAEMQAIVDTISEEQRGAWTLGLAVAVGSSRPRINFLPRALRPRRASPSQLVTAGMACLMALLGMGFLGAQAYQRNRYVQRISQDIQQLDPEVKAVQREADAVIGDPVLGKVVGPDLGRAIPGSHHRTAVARAGGLLFRQHAIQQPGRVRADRGVERDIAAADPVGPDDEQGEGDEAPGDGVAAVVQQHDTGEVLMLGWMDDEALARTLTTGRATYWSRSRNELWKKGLTSGDMLKVDEVRINCEQNSLVYLVVPQGKDRALI